MCFGMLCKYEKKMGPDVGECTAGSKKPWDAACADPPELLFDCEECLGAFTECDGHCLECKREE